MSERTSKLILLLFGVVLAALGAVVLLFFRAERRMARLEEQLARSGALTAASTSREAGRSGAPPIRWSSTSTDGAEPAPAVAAPRKRGHALQAPAQPKMPEGRKFAEENDLDELQWRTLTKLNAYWMDALKKASEQGEGSLTDSLADTAKQRAIKLRAVLGSDEGLASYREFEGSLQENRVTYKAKDGTVYGAAPFE